MLYGIVVNYTNLSGKKLHRQVGVGWVVTSGSLRSEMVRTLPWNERDVGLIHVLGAIFPISITPMSFVALIMNLCKLCNVWLLNLSCVCVCQVSACIYVIISLSSLMVLRRRA